jgi:hypothetical protein
MAHRRVLPDHPDCLCPLDITELEPQQSGDRLYVFTPVGAKDPLGLPLPLILVSRSVGAIDLADSADGTLEALKRTQGRLVDDCAAPVPRPTEATLTVEEPCSPGEFFAVRLERHGVTIAPGTDMETKN